MYIFIPVLMSRCDQQSPNRFLFVHTSPLFRGIKSMNYYSGNVLILKGSKAVNIPRMQAFLWMVTGKMASVYDISRQLSSSCDRKARHIPVYLPVATEEARIGKIKLKSPHSITLYTAFFAQFVLGDWFACVEIISLWLCCLLTNTIIHH